MGGRIKPMNDTEILKEMIISDAQVPLQQQGRQDAFCCS